MLSSRRVAEYAEYAEINSGLVELSFLCRSGFSRELSIFATKVALTTKQYNPLRSLRLFERTTC